jgi:hypothetical protein
MSDNYRGDSSVPPKNKGGDSWEYNSDDRKYFTKRIVDNYYYFYDEDRFLP